MFNNLFWRDKNIVIDIVGAVCDHVLINEVFLGDSDHLYLNYGLITNQIPNLGISPPF
jgi:hypothetical protein